MNYREEFLDQYRKFEDWARKHYPKMQDMKYLEQNYSLESYYKQLEFYRYTRNLLTHYGEMRGTPVNEMITVNQSMLTEFQLLVNELERPALERSVTIENVISRGMDDFVYEAIDDMVERNFTHMPILKDGRVVGVFGEKTLFEMIHENVVVDQDIRFDDIYEYIRVDKIYSEPVHMPVHREKTLPECRQEFSFAIKNGRRLDLLFITEDGTYNSPLLGLITTWDVAGSR